MVQPKTNALNNTQPNPIKSVVVPEQKPQNQQIAGVKPKQTESFDVSSTGGSLEKKGQPPQARRPDAMNNTKHIYMDTSRAEQQAGVNVSYDNSFTVI
jgi:hypothetical protein